MMNNMRSFDSIQLHIVGERGRQNHEIMAGSSASEDELDSDSVMSCMDYDTWDKV